MPAPTNLYEYYTGQGKSLPSLSERSQLYANYGLGDSASYQGTAEQNTALLAKLNTPSNPVINNTNTGVVDSSTIRNEEVAKTNEQLKADINQQTELDRLERERRITEIKNELSGGTTAPKAPSMLETYKTLTEEQGLNADNTELADIRAQKLKLQDQYNAEKRELQGGGGIVQSFYEGAISEKGRAAQALMDNLNTREELVLDRINTKNAFISTVMGLTQTDYENASKEYDAEYNRNLNAQQIYNSEATEAKQNASAYLTSVSTLIQNSGKSLKDLDTSMLNDIRTAELKAGWIPGTLETFMTANPKAKILSTSEGYDANGNGLITFIYSDENGNPGMIRTVGTGTKKEVAGEGGMTTAQKVSTINSIVSGFRSEPIVKEYNTIAGQMAFIDTVGETPTDDMARVYAFAKIMDPNSVVREGEYKTVQDYSQAVLQATGLKAKRIFDNTGFLTDEARNFMKNTLGKRLAATKAQYDNLWNEYNDQVQAVESGQIRGLPQYTVPGQNQTPVDLNDLDFKF